MKFLGQTLGALALGLVLPMAGAWAQTDERPSDEIRFLGDGRLFNNDVIGDGEDRWRTGSYGVSLFYGPEWQGQLGSNPRDVLELRFRAEVIAPANLTNPTPNDRPYAGILAFGLHSHFARDGAEVALGVDVVGVGEQTGLRGFHRSLHDRLDQPAVNTANVELADDIRLHATAEIGAERPLGTRASLRPFVEAQLGVEDIARIGADVTIGSFGANGLRLRDPITGQRFLGIESERPDGVGVLLGADAAYVGGSRLLPQQGGLRAESARYRARAGLAYAQDGYSLFYGVTYLSPEFVAQPEGQVVGSLSLGWRF